MRGRAVEGLNVRDSDTSPLTNHEFDTRMSTHVERNHVVHVAGNSARDCTDIERYQKTRPPTSCHQNPGANLETFAKE